MAAETNALLHTWSLSVEEQFYFIFPAFLAAGWRLSGRLRPSRSRRSTTAVLVLLATLISFAISCYTTYRPVWRLGTSFAFYSPVTRAWEFGFGVLVALAALPLARWTRSFAVPMGIVGAVLIAIGMVKITAETGFPGLPALLPVLGTTLVLVAGMSTAGGVASLLSTLPMVWVGDVSYGWYLWHWPLIVFAAALWPGNAWMVFVAAVASLGPTVLSYRYLENRIRFNDRFVGRRVMALAVACIFIPIAACLGLLLMNRFEEQTPVVKEFAAATRSHEDRARGCDNVTPIGDRADRRCTWEANDPRGTVFLVGDSTAGQFTEPAALAAAQEGFDLTVATSAGCPFADVLRMSGTEGGVPCRRFVTSSVEELVRQRPSLVLIASSSSEYVEASSEILQDPRSGEVASTPGPKAKVWEAGLASVLRQLGDAGVPTVVIHTAPQLQGALGDGWRGISCPFVRIASGSCGGSISREAVEQQQKAAREAEKRAVGTDRDAATVDFTEDLCSSIECSSDRSGVLLHRDSGHLSVDGALTLTERFRRLIGERVRRD